MRYRRANVAGGTYFFTVNPAERKRNLLVDHVDLLRAVMHKVKKTHPVHIRAIVILPDHPHSDYSTRWALIKAGFSRCLPKDERRSQG
jgi:putative transposase